MAVNQLAQTVNETTTAMTSTDIGLTVAFSVIVLINFLGNGLVCLVVIRFRGMRAPINYLLVNLAISDMLVGLGITLQYVIKWTYRHPKGTAGDYMCRFISGGTFVWIGGAASVFSLTAIAAERYLTVVRPRGELPGRNNRRLTAVILGSWIYALVFNLPLFFVARCDDTKFHCREQWPNKTLAEAYTIGAFFLFAGIPIGTMAILYSRLLCKLWKSAQPERVPLISDQTKLKARLKVTKMVSLVSILYAVCWLPNLVLYMLSQFKPDLYAYGSDTYMTSVVLVGLNSAMNPFVYTLCSANFRQNIRIALSFGRSRSAITL